MQKTTVDSRSFSQKKLVQYSQAAPEVLAPAGNLATLKTAIDFGADAVYAGGRAFGMRSAPKNFTVEDFESACSYAHARNARVYVTVNILPNNEEIDPINRYIGELSDIGVDAIIVTDIGVLMQARRIAPNLDVHISTQAGITNYQAACALAELGARRVVLARELDLSAIKEIRAHVPRSLEIEAFVHGSMCMAFSGRCLISQYQTGRDANHGDCVQACRWKYHVVEEKNPGEFIPVEIDNTGSFLFNSRDMNMLEHVPDVIEAGVSSLKIEGRAKGAYYVAAMANAYKTAVKEYMRQRDEGKPVRYPRWLLQEPYKVTHRAYCTGFYYQDNPAGQETHVGGYINDWRLLGQVVGYCEKDKRLSLIARNKISPRMNVEFLLPGGKEPIKFCVPERGFLDEYGKEVPEINFPAHKFSIPCDIPILSGALMRVEVGAAFAQ